MTCKKFWLVKNCLKRECLAGSPRSQFGAGNPQCTRGAPRKQFEGGIEVSEAALKRLFGNNGAVIESIKRAHPCVIGVFKKGRPMPLLHVVAFSQHHLDGVLRCVKDVLSRPAPQMQTVHIHVAADIHEYYLKTEVFRCQCRYPHTSLTFCAESETLTIRGPATQVELAAVDVRMALPNKVTQTVFGPAGVLIGSCGETIGTVRVTYNVDVVISGDSALITGWPSNVYAAVAWYEELFRSFAERRERWAAIKAYKRSTRQNSEASIALSASSASCYGSVGGASSVASTSVSREVSQWVW